MRDTQDVYMNIVHIQVMLPIPLLIEKIPKH